jgi:hypothetical protein
MPSVSKKQHNLMAAVAHNPKFAKKVGIPQSVGKEFNKADKGKQFKRGGEMAESNKMVKKEVAFMKSKGAPKSMIKHEMGEAGMKKGGAKPGVYAGLTGKPVRRPTDLGDDVRTSNPKDAAAMKAAAAKAAKAQAVFAKKSASAPKPTSNPMDDTPEAKLMRTPAMKKGGKVCGMKAGGVKKDLPTAKDLGSMNMKKGGRVKCMAGGGYVRAADGVTKKGKTKGKII